MKPLVTVITATSNLIKNNRLETFIQAVNSVREQTYKNIEHIIIDNFSTDGTQDFFKKNGLTYFSEKDDGIFDAYNKGVRYAKGKYIIFLNSDDYYHNPEGIEKCVNILEKSDADFCFSKYNAELNPDTIVEVEPDIYNTFRLMPVSHQAIMCKRELLEKYPFDIKYKRVADYKWFMSLILDKIPYIEHNCNFVTFRLGGQSNNNIPQSVEETKKIYKEILTNIYPELSDEDINRACETSIWPENLERILMSYFPDKILYNEAMQCAYAQRTGSVPVNALTNRIKQKITDENSCLINDFLKRFRFLWPFIYRLLFKKLLDDDKELFVNFLLKRFLRIETASEEEIENLNILFKHTANIYQERKNNDEGLEINLFNKKALFFSNTPLYNAPLSIEQELLSYYEYVHSFILKEYILDGFEPENGQTILDCGAACGDTMLLFKLKYPNSPVFSFECDDNCFNTLMKNIEVNEYKDAQAVKTFLSNKNDDTNMTIDKLVKEYNIQNIGLIKFDIEGAERYALEGAKNTILTQKPILIIPIYHLEDDCFQIPKILNSLNLPCKYRLKWIEKRVYGVDCTLFVKFE